jgi:hypothetical protein
LEAGSKPHKVRDISETGWEEVLGVLKTRDEVELVMEEETLRSPPSGGRKKTALISNVPPQVGHSSGI